MKAHPSPRRPPTAWQKSAEFRAIAVAALRKFNENQTKLPKCSAKAKSTGERCAQPAMRNGVCRYHGGKTPKGDDWHKPVWPADGPAFEAKLASKTKALDKRRRGKAADLAKMTDEERAKHECWQKAHKPGSAGARARTKKARQDAVSFRAVVEAPPAERPRDPELEALDIEIAAAHRQAVALEINLATNEGIFG